MTNPHRKVTEADLRHPAYANVQSPDELEFDDFGAIVPKDRYQKTVRSLGIQLYQSLGVWFVDTLKEDLLALLQYVQNFSYDQSQIEQFLDSPATTREELGYLLPALEHSVTVLLKNGSLLTDAVLHLTKQPNRELTFELSWRGTNLTDDVQAFRTNEKSPPPLLSLIQDRQAWSHCRTMSTDDYQRKVNALRQHSERIAPPGGV